MNRKVRIGLEVAILSAIISLLWVLGTIPIIIFNISQQNTLRDTSTEFEIDNSMACSSVIQYGPPNDLCEEEFSQALSSAGCYSNSEEPVLVVLRNSEEEIRQFISALDFLGSSDECKTEARTFACLYLFGLCSQHSGILIQPTSDYCKQVRDLLCPLEWLAAQQFGIDLPNCDLFTNEDILCQNFSDNRNLTVHISDLQNSTSETGRSSGECSDEFYRDNSTGQCVPECHTWTLYGKAQSTFNYVVIVGSSLAGIVTTFLIIIFSFIKRKTISLISSYSWTQMANIFVQMLKFPSILVLYIALDIVFMALVTIPGFIAHGTFYCSSRNLIQSTQDVTPYCTFQGISVNYCLLQILYWWLFHVGVFVWSIYFPFQYRSFKLGNKMKYLHLISITVAIILPSASIAATMGRYSVEIKSSSSNASFWSSGAGYVPGGYPPICTGRDSSVFFYSYLLILDISLTVGCTLLILSIWPLIKETMKRHQNGKKSNVMVKFNAPEKKLLVLFAYYVIMGTFSLSAFSLYLKNGEQFFSAIQSYILCERNGHHPSNQCSRAEFETINHPTVSVIGWALFALLPMALLLLYVINLQDVRKLFKRSSPKKQLTTRTTMLQLPPTAYHSYPLNVN